MCDGTCDVMCDVATRRAALAMAGGALHVVREAKTMRQNLIRIALVLSPLLGGSAHAQLPHEPSTLQDRPHRVFLDVKGDGLDLEGCGAMTRRRAPRASSDDRLLAVDVTEAAKIGYRIQATAGPLGRAAPFGDGLRVTTPTGAARDPSDGWAMFALFDSNGDGLLDATDLAWSALRVGRDANGDGLLDGPEIEKMGALDIATLGPRSPTRTERDAHGSDLSFGAFARKDRTLGRMADVSLAACTPGKTR
jgi:hypothetical protein